MELRDTIRLLVIVGSLAFYLGFVIRLLRSGRRKVIIPALEFSLRMLLTPFLFPYFLIILRKNKKLEELVQVAMDDVLRTQEISKAQYESMYHIILSKLSSPSYFLRFLGELLVDYLRNWDKHIDSLISTVPKRESARLSFVTTLIDRVSRLIHRNKIFHLGMP